MPVDLCTDLRRVSACSSSTATASSALTSALNNNSEQQSPWLAAAEQLRLFPPERCVQLRPAEWQQLSGILCSISRQCAAAVKASTTASVGSSCPAFAATLELLARLGQVTSALLCVNGDDCCFSIARVAQAIRTTTSVLEAAIAQAAPAGLSAEVADSLARQRCEQTPLLSAATWALRQEARALFFNPRPTALSLATALLDLFTAVEQLWPQGIFVLQQHELHIDATAARMADPAAALALAMLRCAGRAWADVGPGACRESLLCGLRVGYDMVAQISCMLGPSTATAQLHECLIKQLQQSPSLPQLMLALLAVETHRLNQQLGVSETDSCIQLQQQGRQGGELGSSSSRRRSSQQSQRCSLNPEQPQGTDAGGDQQQQQQGPEKQLRLSGAGSVGQSRRRSGSVGSPVMQQQQQEQQQPQQQQQEEEEHQEIEGAGELHQLWHEVLGMARKHLERDQQQDDVGAEPPTRSPLMQLWVSLGLPEGLLQLAADASPGTLPPAQQYVAVCRVGKFLLAGSPLLQPQHGLHEHFLASPSAAAAAGAVASTQAGGGSSTLQPSLSAAAAAAGVLGGGSSSAQQQQLQSPFAGFAARSPSRTQSLKAAAGALPLAWQQASSSSPRQQGAAGLFGSSSSPGVAAHTPLAAALSLGDLLLASVGSLSPRDLPFLPRPGGATSMSAEAAEQLMESCRDYGLRGQEQLELLRLQRVVPVVLLNTAAKLLEHHHAAAAAATTGGDVLEVVHAACTAAACVSRCWPVLQKVAAQQEELCDLLAECQPPAGVYTGLTTVCWRPYTLPAEVRLPVLPLLQLVVKLMWQLQPSWQQVPQTQQQQPQGGAGGDGGSTGGGSAAAAAAAAAAGPSTTEASASSSSSSRQILSPVSGECIDCLLEVLTAASKLPWETHPNSHRKQQHDDGCSSSSVESAGELDAQLVAEAWQQECQPVAAAVEACLRTAGQVAAAADGALDWRPGGLDASAAAAAGGAGPRKGQRHPSAVALGSCLASLCAPLGRPGPLVAAAAAAAPGGPEQQQLWSLLSSKVKVLLYNPASNKARLVAMHPIEQTPVFIIQHLRSSAANTLTATAAAAAGPTGSQAQLSGDTAAAAAAAAGVSAAMLPWLLLLARLMVLRGKLLAHVLQHECDSSSSKAGATSTLHTAYWHVKMAHESASTLAAHLRPGSDPGSGTAPLPAHHHQQQQMERLWSELQLQLLPALKQAVQVLRAAMKLSRHCTDTSYAQGFAAGFAAGHAAALAAASGGVLQQGSGAPGPVSFASPWGVLQQGCIRVLPQLLQSVGCGLAWQLRHEGCANPWCVNLSLGSELWLLQADGSGQRQGAAAGGGDSGLGEAALCCSCSKAGVRAESSCGAVVCC